MIQTIVIPIGVKKSYNNLYGLINETGIYNRNKVIRIVLYDLYKRMEYPA